MQAYRDVVHDYLLVFMGMFTSIDLLCLSF